MELSIDFTSFAIRKMGFIQSETVLKLDEYSLQTAPYQLSGERMLLLAALNKYEIALFQRFEGGLAGISMAFQKPGDKRPLRLFARCAVKRVAEMPQREGIALFETELKNVPADLARIVGDYASILDCLREDYARFKGQTVKVMPASSRLLRFGNKAEFFVGAKSREVAVFSLAADRIEFILSPRAEGLARGDDCAVKLYFAESQFFVRGKIAEIDEPSAEVSQVVADIEFSPELMETLAEYRLRARGAEKAD